MNAKQSMRVARATEMLERTGYTHGRDDRAAITSLLFDLLLLVKHMNDTNPVAEWNKRPSLRRMLYAAEELYDSEMKVDR